MLPCAILESVRGMCIRQGECQGPWSLAEGHFPCFFWFVQKGEVSSRQLYHCSPSNRHSAQQSSQRPAQLLSTLTASISSNSSGFHFQHGRPHIIGRPHPAAVCCAVWGGRGARAPTATLSLSRTDSVSCDRRLSSPTHLAKSPPVASFHSSTCTGFPTPPTQMSYDAGKPQAPVPLHHHLHRGSQPPSAATSVPPRPPGPLHHRLPRGHSDRLSPQPHAAAPS